MLGKEIKYKGTKFNVEAIRGTKQSDFVKEMIQIPQIMPQVPRLEKEDALKDLWLKVNPPKQKEDKESEAPKK